MTLEAIKHQRHKWSEPVSILDGTPTGCEQTERTCSLCHLVKITVHPPQGFPWRAWRHRSSSVQFTDDYTPPCDGTEAEPDGRALSA